MREGESSSHVLLQFSNRLEDGEGILQYNVIKNIWFGLKEVNMHITSQLQANCRIFKSFFKEKQAGA